jgi:hypothetical protein
VETKGRRTPNLSNLVVAMCSLLSSFVTDSTMENKVSLDLSALKFYPRTFNLSLQIYPVLLRRHDQPLRREESTSNSSGAVQVARIHHKQMLVSSSIPRLTRLKQIAGLCPK